MNNQTLISTDPVSTPARFSLANAFALALILAFAPVLTSTALYGAEPVGVVNINTADAQTLAERLVGVGLSRAEAIVRYREEHGRFVAVEELTAVSGIGPATVERNRAIVVLE